LPGDMNADGSVDVGDLGILGENYGKMLPPLAPGNLAAEAQSGPRVSLTWADSGGHAAGWQIERRPEGSGTWTVVARVAGADVGYVDQDVNPSSRYFYRITAYNDGGNSLYSNTADVITLGTPAAPSNLTIAAVSHLELDLAWEDHAVNESGFWIERSPNGVDGWVLVGTAQADATAFSNLGLARDTTYYYRVCAYNEQGNSAYSNVASATTLHAVITQSWDGVNGDHWPSTWTVNAVKGNTPTLDIQNNKGRITRTGTDLGYDNTSANTAVDVDETVTFQTNNMSNYWAGLFARRADSDPDTCYFVKIYSSGTKLGLFKMINGTETSIGAGVDLTGFAVYTDWKVRLKVTTVGSTTQLQAKAWKATDSEPANWMLDLTNNVLQGVRGRVGVYWFSNATGREGYFDNFTATLDPV